MKRPRLRLRRRKADAGETADTAVAGPTQASGPPGKPEWPAPGTTGAGGAGGPSGAGGPAGADRPTPATEPKAGEAPKDAGAGKDGIAPKADEEGAKRDGPPGAEAEAAAARPVDPHERIDGLRAWLADVERKLAIRTYAIGAATVLALAAAIVAIVLIYNLQDEAATTDDVRALENQIGIVREEAETAVEQRVSDLVDRVETLEQRISRIADDQTGIDRELQAFQDDIDDLREQLFDLEDEVAQGAQAGGGGGGGGGGGPGPDIP